MTGSRNHGLRATRQGSLIRDQLATSNGFQSAQAVYAVLRAAGETVGLATVYRHLQALTDAGDADTLQNGDGETLYRLCGQSSGHHHHLVCRHCGQTVEIENPHVEHWATRAAADHGYTNVAHTVELIGTCPNCVIT